MEGGSQNTTKCTQSAINSTTLEKKSIMSTVSLRANLETSFHFVITLYNVCLGLPIVKVINQHTKYCVSVVIKWKQWY